MKRPVTGALGRYAAFLIIALIGTIAILIVIKASTIADTSIQDAKRSDDIDYQLRKLREAQEVRN